MLCKLHSGGMGGGLLVLVKTDALCPATTVIGPGRGGGGGGSGARGRGHNKQTTPAFLLVSWGGGGVSLARSDGHPELPAWIGTSTGFLRGQRSWGLACEAPGGPAEGGVLL